MGGVTAGALVTGGYYAGLAYRGTEIAWPDPTLLPTGGTGDGPHLEATQTLAAGAYVGIGLGGFLTNATRREDLNGTFDNVNLNLPFVSVVLAYSGAGAGQDLVYQLSVIRGRGWGVSISTYATDTATVDPLGVVPWIVPRQTPWRLR